MYICCIIVVEYIIFRYAFSSIAECAAIPEWVRTRVGWTSHRDHQQSQLQQLEVALLGHGALVLPGLHPHPPGR